MLNLLATMLGCGRNELAYIEDCKYDLGEIGEELLGERLEINLPNVCDTIFIYGQRELDSAFSDLMQKKKDRLSYLKSWRDDKKFTDESEKELETLEEELAELEDLNPSDDMTWTVQDEYACYLENREIYEKHLGKKFELIESNMGFEFEEP